MLQTSVDERSITTLARAQIRFEDNVKLLWSESHEDLRAKASPRMIRKPTRGLRSELG
jgi:hypothetical protein